MTVAKLIDGAAGRFALFTIYLIWLNYLIGNFWGALGIAVLCALVTVLIIKKIAEKTNKVKYDKNLFFNQLALNGNEYTLNLYLSHTAEKACGNHLIDNGTLYYSAFRFSEATCDDVAAAYRTARDGNADKITFLCTGASRNVQLMAAALPLEFRFVFKNDIFRALKERDSLPALVQPNKEKVKLPPVKTVLSAALSSTNVKYYVFSGGLLAAMSFLTPYKLYYVIMASLSLALAVASKIYDK